MIVDAQVAINGSKAAFWAAITNIENASNIVKGIVAGLQSLPVFPFKGVVKKALLQDLSDIRSAVEQE